MESDDDTIRNAYLQRVRAFSPDSEPDLFRLVQTAYERIKTAEARARQVMTAEDPEGALPDVLEAYVRTSTVMLRPPEVEALRRAVLFSM